MLESMTAMVMACLYSMRPPLLWGPPGVGKTMFARHLAQQIGARSFFVCLSHKADNEVHGQPVIGKKMVTINGQECTIVEQAPPQYMVEACSAKNDKCVGSIIVYDELTCIPPATAGPALAIFGEHRIADRDLPADVATIACANPADMAAGGWSLAPPTSRRFTHINFKLNAHDWSEHFPGYWDSPPELGRFGFAVPEEEWSQERSLVAAFIRAFPELLFQYPKEAAKRGGCWTDNDVVHVGGWANPATWDAASRHMTVCRLKNLSDVVCQDLLIGALGSETTMHFQTWKEKMDMPTPRELLAKPEKVSRIPMERADQLYFAVHGVIALFKNSLRKHVEAPKDEAVKRQAISDWKSCWEIAGRVAMGEVGRNGYHENIKQVVSNKRAMKGPLDIAAIGVKLLEGAAREGKLKGAPVHEVSEIDLFPSILKGAGLNWDRTGQNNK
jgi:ATPase family associated with various cellular activities (AAA)